MFDLLLRCFFFLVHSLCLCSVFSPSVHTCDEFDGIEYPPDEHIFTTTNSMNIQYDRHCFASQHEMHTVNLLHALPGRFLITIKCAWQHEMQLNGAYSIEHRKMHSQPYVRIRYTKLMLVHSLEHKNKYGINRGIVGIVNETKNDEEIKEESKKKTILAPSKREKWQRKSKCYYTYAKWFEV